MPQRLFRDAFSHSARTFQNKFFTHRVHRHTYNGMRNLQEVGHWKKRTPGSTVIWVVGRGYPAGEGNHNRTHNTTFLRNFAGFGARARGEQNLLRKKLLCTLKQQDDYSGTAPLPLTATCSCVTNGNCATKCHNNVYNVHYGAVGVQKCFTESFKLLPWNNSIVYYYFRSVAFLHTKCSVMYVVHTIPWAYAGVTARIFRPQKFSWETIY